LYPYNRTIASAARNDRPGGPERLERSFLQSLRDNNSDIAEGAFRWPQDRDAMQSLYADDASLDQTTIVRSLARECAKLDPEAEKALAEEGLGSVLSEWPAY
jgi:hypothetical protein